MREPLLQLVRTEVSHIEISARFTALLHLGVDRPRNNVARRQAGETMVFLHECGAVAQFEDSAFAANRLADQERLCRRMEQRGGMKLDELHVCHHRAGTPTHRHAVAGGDGRVCGMRVNLPHAATGQHRGLRVKNANLARATVQRGGPAAHPAADQKVQREVVFENGDLGVMAHRRQQRPLNFAPREVLRVNDAAP